MVEIINSLSAILITLGIILMYLVLGALTFLGVAQVEAGEPTPWVGLVEHTMVYGYMLWVAVLAILLLRMKNRLRVISEIDLYHRSG
jgi:hypothetical protein